jgi:hypothetical protein
MKQEKTADDRPEPESQGEDERPDNWVMPWLLDLFTPPDEDEIESESSG